MKLSQLGALAALIIASPLPLLAQDAESVPIQDTDGPSDIYNNSGFEYVLPGPAAEFPGLNEQLTAERESARAEFDEMVGGEREASPGSAMLDHLASQTRWNVAGRAGRLLSLTDTTYVFSGGAHGMTGYAARIWDMEEDHAVDFAYLFTDRYAAFAIIDREFCGQLAAMQAERGVPSDDSWWNSCPLLHEQAIAPGGEEGGPLSAIEVVVGPYVAGPYSAGSFEISVPVTRPLLDLVKPEYRDAFAVE